MPNLCTSENRPVPIEIDDGCSQQAARREGGPERCHGPRWGRESTKDSPIQPTAANGRKGR